jgi:hypothetical protein
MIFFFSWMQASRLVETKKLRGAGLLCSMVRCGVSPDDEVEVRK